MKCWRVERAAVISCLSSAALASCGLGTAGITAAAGGGGGSGNSAPSVSAFRIEGNRETPAQIRFTVSDADSDPATIEFCYQVDDGTGFGPPAPLTQIEAEGLMLPVGTNPVTFPADRDGEDYTVDWSFPMEAQLPDDGSFKRPVRVIAIVQGGVQVLTIGVNGDFGMGNDPPVVTVSSPPPAEVSGIVPLDFNVSDSSGDLVSVLVEYDLAADVPDAGWQPATSSGSFLPFEAPERASTCASSGTPRSTWRIPRCGSGTRRTTGSCWETPSRRRPSASTTTPSRWPCSTRGRSSRARTAGAGSRSRSRSTTTRATRRRSSSSGGVRRRASTRCPPIRRRSGRSWPIPKSGGSTASRRSIRRRPGAPSFPSGTAREPRCACRSSGSPRRACSPTGSWAASSRSCGARSCPWPSRRAGRTRCRLRSPRCRSTARGRSCWKAPAAGGGSPGGTWARARCSRLSSRAGTRAPWPSSQAGARSWSPPTRAAPGGSSASTWRRGASPPSSRPRTARPSAAASAGWPAWVARRR